MEPNIYVMDNKASKDLKDVIQNSGIKYQLVSPHNYRTNLSEKLVHNFKAHFKAGLASLDP